MMDSTFKLDSTFLPTALMPSLLSRQLLPPYSPPGRSPDTSAKCSAPSTPPALSPARKWAAVTNVPRPHGLPQEQGEYIARDTRLLHSLGWHGLVAHCRPLSDFSLLDNVPHLHIACYATTSTAARLSSSPPRLGPANKSSVPSHGARMNLPMSIWITSPTNLLT